MKLNQKGLAPVLIIFFLVGVFFVVITWIKILRNSVSTKQNLAKESQVSQQDVLSSEELQQKQSLESFLNDDQSILNNNISFYPEFKSEIPKSKIKRAFNIKLHSELKDESGKPKSGWVIEIEKEQGLFTYYLLTENLQKELTNVMSANIDDKGTYCKVEKIQDVGNEINLNRTLDDRNGYLVLTGSCMGYGGGNFVSVFKLTNGEKIILKGSFSQPGTPYKGVSSSGSALGRLRGVYGVNNPTIIVEYGYDRVSAIEKVAQLAFFDLQTGILNQLIKFQ